MDIRLNMAHNLAHSRDPQTVNAENEKNRDAF